MEFGAEDQTGQKDSVSGARILSRSSLRKLFVKFFQVNQSSHQCTSEHVSVLDEFGDEGVQGRKSRRTRTASWGRRRRRVGVLNTAWQHLECAVHQALKHLVVDWLV